MLGVELKGPPQEMQTKCRVLPNALAGEVINFTFSDYSNSAPKESTQSPTPLPTPSPAAGGPRQQGAIRKQQQKKKKKGGRW